MTAATISHDGKITIPESIRKRLNLKAGMRVGTRKATNPLRTHHWRW